MHQERVREQGFNQLDDVLILIVEVCDCLFDLHGVPATILRFQVVWRAEHHESTVDHDRDLVAKLLSLVHAMSGEEHRGVLHTLDHSVKRAS